MLNVLALLFSFAALPPAFLQQAPTAQKVEVVAVMGCLKQQTTNNDWMLVNATDPVASRATTPTPDQLPKEPGFGKNQFKLIGVSEFGLPDKKDKAVLVKGMYLKGTPVSRLNITSVTVIASSCAAAK
jgi:hypothetical protein